MRNNCDPNREMAFQKIVETWLPIIKGAVLYYGITGHDFEDFSQQLLVDIFEKRYDQIYDPSKGALSVFIYAMVRKRRMSFKSKSGKDAMRRPCQFVGEDEWLLDKPDSIDVISSREFWGLVDKVRKTLSKIERRRKVKGGHRNIRYSLGDIFQLVVGGSSSVQIHRETGYSESSVSLFLKDFRQRDDVQKLRDYWKGNFEKKKDQV